MTDISDITVTITVEQKWTWPSLGRAIAVIRAESQFGETTLIKEFEP